LLARLRDPGVQPVGFSSYDRTGGNNDGFNGTYSRIRAEDGNSVLAEVDGPGVVQRIWFTHTSGEPDGRKPVATAAAACCGTGVPDCASRTSKMETAGIAMGLARSRLGTRG
ncbi:MAG: hypothetical protein ACXVBO_21830, partial [Isosphaeraceae bacterium]